MAYLVTRFLPLTGLGLLAAPAVHAQQYQSKATGLRVSTDSLTVEVQFYSPELVRVVKQPEGNPTEKKGLVVVQAPAPDKLKYSAKNGLVTIGSPTSQVVVNEHHAVRSEAARSFRC